jgi:hypothetical protein
MLREAQVVGVGDDWDRLESPFVGKRSNQPMVKPCKTHNAESLVADTPEVALAIPQPGYCWRPEMISSLSCSPVAKVLEGLGVSKCVLDSAECRYLVSSRQTDVIVWLTGLASFRDRMRPGS